MRFSLSSFCRLCGEENDKGLPLFNLDVNGTCLSQIINQYLPVKVVDDGIFPTRICSRCHNQLQATVSFIELMAEGQKKLRELRNKITSDATNIAEHFLVQEVDQVLFSHNKDLSLSVEGEDKPKKKRGRPKKIVPSTETVCQPEKPEEEVLSESDKKEKRRRKIPVRYLEAIQEPEIDGVLQDGGVGIEPLVTAEFREEIIGHVETKDGVGVMISNSPRKIKFQCEICSELFINQGKFLDHMSTHSVFSYQCTLCLESFPSESELSEHQRTSQHTGVLKLDVAADKSTEESSGSKCDICKKTFDTKQELEKHMTEHSEKKRRKPTCPICRKQFKFNCSLKGHMLSSHKNQGVSSVFPCDSCPKKFKHSSSLAYHKETEHSNGLRYVCIKCNRYFKHPQLLRKHQLVHTENRPYFCKVCSSAFKTKSNLFNHMAIHSGEKKYFCELCGHQFAHKTSLTLHYRWHTGNKPYECDVCKKKFTQKGNLHEHARIHTGEKPYQCEICRRRFTTSSQCKLHIKRHTGERPWKCEYCSKTFLHKDTWKCHVRRHRGEKPYCCNYCSREFPERWALKKHMRMHTGERPYSCEVCGRTFSDCSNLAKHKKVHNKDSISPLDGQTSDAEALQDFWDIIRTQDEDPHTIDTIDESVIADAQHVIYVSYTDPSDPTANKVVSEKLLVGPAVSHTTEIVNPIRVEDDLDDTSQMLVMDEHGNPIYFTMADGTQLQVTSNGKNLQAMTAEGNVIPIKLTTQEGQSILTQSVLTPATEITHLVTEGVEDSISLEDQSTDIEFTSEDNQNVKVLSLLSSSSYLTLA